MVLERDFVKYGAELSLGLISISSAYFVQISKLSTLIFLLPTIFLLAYTAYISKNSFQKSSLMIIPVIFFAPLGNIFLALSVFIVTSNILVSLFAEGDSFRGFYGVSSIPLLISGILVGSTFFFLATSNPELQDNIENKTANIVGEKTETIINGTNLISSQREKQIQVVNKTSRTTVMLTRAYVLNRTDLGVQDMEKLDSAFMNASREVPARIVRKTNNSLDTSGVDFSERSEDLFETLYRDEFLFLIIPVVGFGIYSLSPIVGIIIAIFGLMIRETDSYIKSD